MSPDKANSHRVNSVAVFLCEDNMGLSAVIVRHGALDGKNDR